MAAREDYHGFASSLWLYLCIVCLIRAVNADVVVFSEMQCEDLCLRSGDCTTYTVQTIGGKKKCFLNAAKGKTLLLRERLALNCVPNPCQHGGKCTEDPSTCRRIICNCKKNWTGRLCNLKVKDVGEAWHDSDCM